MEQPVTVMPRARGIGASKAGGADGKTLSRHANALAVTKGMEQLMTASTRDEVLIRV
jgi:hypothetical protein